jgi:hypothetical protein
MVEEIAELGRTTVSLADEATWRPELASPDAARLDGVEGQNCSKL